MSLTRLNLWRKSISISTAFSLFLFSTSCIFALTIAFVVSRQVDALVDNSRQEYIDKEIRGIAAELEQFIRVRHLLLDDYTRFPVMVQGIMQPGRNASNIQDFINEMLILGKSYPTSILDFEANLIYQTADMKLSEPQKLNLLSQSPKYLSSNVSLIKGVSQSYWRLVSSIQYHQQTEGFLLVDIPLTQVVTELNLQQRLDQHKFEILKGETVVWKFGANLTTMEYRLNIPSIDTTFQYRTDQTTIKKMQQELLFEIVGFIGLILVLVLGLSVWFGRIYFVNPIQKLSIASIELANGNTSHPDSFDKSLLEFKSLATNFNTMVYQFQHRESSLLAIKQDLETANLQLKEQQAQLVHSEKMASIGQLAAGVAHEINNPTGYVSGNLEVLTGYVSNFKLMIAHYRKAVLRADKSLIQGFNDIENKLDIRYIEQDIDELLSDSTAGLKRIRGIVKDLQHFSRFEGEQRRQVDINKEVIEPALRLVWNEIKYKCRLDKKLQVLPKYACFPGEIGQVIVNLLMNACDAIETQGVVSLTSECNSKAIFIKVGDDGAGISHEHLQRLFDPFFTTKEIGKGTGLGLSISHGIIDKHGGTLTASSESGKGAVFTIRLPI